MAWTTDRHHPFDDTTVPTLGTRLLRVVACATAALLASPSWADGRTITCYSDVFAPYVTLEGSDIRGIDVDAIAEAGRRVGIKVNGLHHRSGQIDRTLKNWLATAFRQSCPTGKSGWKPWICWAVPTLWRTEPTAKSGPVTCSLWTIAKLSCKSANLAGSARD